MRQAPWPSGTDSTRYLTHEDVRSIVTYLRSVPPIKGGESRPRDQWASAVDDITALRAPRSTR